MYRGASILGDVEAARKGPSAAARRLVRKQAYRRAGGGFRRFLRVLGL
jgi:hypothetical protein